MGFRKGRGTIEAIYCVKALVEERLRKKEKEKAFVFFADMKAAFDKLDRNELRRMLNRARIGRSMTERIMDIYKDTRVTVKVKDKLIGSFRTWEGVRQGCPLSPLLFNIAFSDLEDEMSKTLGGGISIRRKRVYSIAYADDIALMASTKEAMEKELYRFRRYIKRKSLTLNVEKSKILVFRNGRGRRAEIKFE